MDEVTPLLRYRLSAFPPKGLSVEVDVPNTELQVPLEQQVIPQLLAELPLAADGVGAICRLAFSSCLEGSIRDDRGVYRREGRRQRGKRPVHARLHLAEEMVGRDRVSSCQAQQQQLLTGRRTAHGDWLKPAGP
jgi:hypothetical protein